MKSSTFSLRFALAFAALASQACLYPKPVGNDRDGSAADAASDGQVVSDGSVHCVGDDGRTHAAGESFPSADGCNTCSCDAMGRVICTQRACLPDAGSSSDASPRPDSGARTCTSNAQCGSGEMCAGPEGCGVPWTCVAATGCTADFAPFCSCRGVTVHGSSSCPPEPFMHRGECATSSDAGADPDANTSGGCMRTGCSGQLCAAEPLGSTCEFLPEYACYRAAACERQGDGTCGFTPSPSLTACINAARGADR